MNRWIEWPYLNTVVFMNCLNEWPYLTTVNSFKQGPIWIPIWMNGPIWILWIHSNRALFEWNTLFEWMALFKHCEFIQIGPYLNIYLHEWPYLNTVVFMNWWIEPCLNSEIDLHITSVSYHAYGMVSLSWIEPYSNGVSFMNWALFKWCLLHELSPIQMVSLSWIEPYSNGVSFMNGALFIKKTPFHQRDMTHKWRVHQFQHSSQHSFRFALPHTPYPSEYRRSDAGKNKTEPQWWRKKTK